jgi:hypothetical protein
MSRDALKFTDLNTFLVVMERQGFRGQAQELIYEGDKLPFCSAYLIPLGLLPTAFDMSSVDEFGGSIVQVQEINYLGIEKFYTDFMIYPLSMTGFVELGGVSPVTFATENSEQDRDWKHMTYVINLEDGGGQEFFLTAEGDLINLSTISEQQPQEFKTYKLVSRKIDQIREKYPASCQIYPLERREFDRRQSILQSPPTE